MPDFSHRLLVLFLIVIISACQDSHTPSEESHNSAEPVPIHSEAFATILQDVGLRGSILLFDANIGQSYSNDFAWADSGFLPASTFKIPNSMIALETGVVDDATTMFYWDGEPRGMETWEADLTFEQAFKRSCVPCYQEIARGIGVGRMREYLDKFDYGDMDVDSSNLDMFWLQGDSRISQVEQIDFLRRINSRKIPMSDSTFATLNTLMLMEKTDQYKLYGKTGWSISGESNNGWFVGFVTKSDHTWYFATNVIPGDDFDMSLFARIRTQVTKEALISLSILPSS